MFPPRLYRDVRVRTEPTRLYGSTFAADDPPLWSMVTVAFFGGRAFLLYFMCETETG